MLRMIFNLAGFYQTLPVGSIREVCMMQPPESGDFLQITMTKGDKRIGLTDHYGGGCYKKLGFIHTR